MLYIPFVKGFATYTCAAKKLCSIAASGVNVAKQVYKQLQRRIKQQFIYSFSCDDSFSGAFCVYG